MNIIEKKKRQMGQGGFTLIELLVVIAILAVLAGLAVIGIGAMRNNANKTACQADADTLETAVAAYRVESKDVNPAGIASLKGSGYLKRSSKYEASMSIQTDGTVTNAC